MTETERRPVRAVLIGLAIAIALPAVLIPAAIAMNSDDDPPPTSPAVTLHPAAIDGNRAFGYLRQICALGPRIAGTEANTKQRQLVTDHFKANGGQIYEQTFTARHPVTGKRVPMVNVIASWFPDRTERVLIAAHYDTRPHPDEDPDPLRRQGPFLGANDCASGVALMMEISSHLKESPTPWGVDLILLDGEELVYGRTGEFFLGSKTFGAAYKKARRDKKIGYTYNAGILLDMVGGRELTLPREPYSVQYAPKLVNDIWDVAGDLNINCFRPFLGREVLDDHIALNEAGIPTVDIIDFEYPFWHTADDIPEQCSPESLVQVGRVVTAWLNKPKPPATKGR